jgi:hypothetical protein
VFLSEGTVVLVRIMKAYRRGRGERHSLLTSALDAGEWSPQNSDLSTRRLERWCPLDKRLFDPRADLDVSREERGVFPLSRCLIEFIGFIERIRTKYTDTTSR